MLTGGFKHLHANEKKATQQTLSGLGMVPISRGPGERLVFTGRQRL